MDAEQVKALANNVSSTAFRHGFEYSESNCDESQAKRERVDAERARKETHAAIDAMQAEIDRLKAERDAAFAMSKCECESNECCANLVRKDAEIDRLRKDAERYRWIARKTSAHGISDGWQFGFPTALTLPANALAMRDPEAALGQCIDAALSEETKGRKT